MKDNLLIPTDEQLRANKVLQVKIAELNTKGFFTKGLIDRAKEQGYQVQNDEGSNPVVVFHDGRGVA